jgi:hypothetical protein
VPGDVDRMWPPRFARLLDEELLARMAEAVPERGGAERLEKIGWWGGAVCWMTADSEVDETIFQAAAAFNLAVAAFDSVLDRGRESSADLVDALAPHHLHRVLVDPVGESFESVPAEVEPVIGLFHVSLAGFAEVWGDNGEQMSLALDLLTEMYRSEVGELHDPLPAKILPSVFLGLFGTCDRARIDMHRDLGRFLGSWDDWMDLDEDLLAGSPNVFLGVPGGGASYVGRGLRFVVSGGDGMAAQRLGDDLARVIEVVMQLDPLARSRTLGFIDALLR